MAAVRHGRREHDRLRGPVQSGGLDATRIIGCRMSTSPGAYRNAEAERGDDVEHQNASGAGSWQPLSGK